jgi:hypothetical protein
MADRFAKETDFDTLLKRFEAAKDVSRPWHQLYEKVYKYTQPYRNPYASTGSTSPQSLITSGNIQDQSAAKENYDSTPILSTESLVAKLISYVVPSYMHWQEFVPGTQVSEEDREKEMPAAQAFTKQYFRFINNSNFSIAIAEWFKDFCVGTAALYVTRGRSIDKPLNFRAVPIAQLHLEEDSEGNARSVYFERMGFQARNIEILWPDAKMSPECTKALQEDPNYTIDLIEMTIYLESENKYRYLVLDRANEHILLDDVSESSPWIIGRFSKAPYDVWGTGPCTHILSDCQTLNMAVETNLRAAEKKANPMWMVWSDGVFDSSKFVAEAGSVYEVSGINPGHGPIKEVDSNADVRLSEIEIKDIRERIQRAMLVELSRPIDATPVSATEILEKKQQLLEQTSPMADRLQRYVLPELTNRVLFLLNGWNLLDDLKVDGKTIDIVYKSPLARRQDNVEVQAYNQTLQILQQSVGPDKALLGINIPKLPQWLAERTGMDLSMIKTQEEIEEGLKQAEEQAAAQEQAQQGLPQAPQVPQQQPVQF